MTAILKKSLGEAAAFISDEHGDDNLYKVLSSLASGSARLDHFEAALSAASKAQLLAIEATKLTGFAMKLGTTGTAGQTDVDVEVDGAVVASLSVSNAEADGTYKALDLSTPIDIPAGSTVELVVSAVPTAGANLEASAVLSPVALQ